MGSEEEGLLRHQVSIVTQNVDLLWALRLYPDITHVTLTWHKIDVRSNGPSENICLFLFRPRDSVKALKKRIVGNKNFREIMLALTVSDRLCSIVCEMYACMNC